MVLSKVISAFLIKPSWEYDEMPNKIIIISVNNFFMIFLIKFNQINIIIISQIKKYQYFRNVNFINEYIIKL